MGAHLDKQNQKKKDSPEPPKPSSKPSRLEGICMTAGYLGDVAQRWQDNEYLVNLLVTALL